MTTIISTHSFRGGTGKSNVTANLAVLLAERGHRVGVFDTDIQSPGIHVIFGLDDESIGNTLNDFLWKSCRVEEAAYEVYTSANGGSVHLVPSDIHPNAIARILREKYDAGDMHAGFRELIQALSLDYLLIDTHPGLNEETLLSITISDILLIMFRPDAQDFQGTSVTVDIARRLRVPNLALVVNKVPNEFDMDGVRREVAATYDATVGAVIPLSADVAQNASKTVFVTQYPIHPVTRALNDVVDYVEQVAAAETELVAA